MLTQKKCLISLEREDGKEGHRHRRWRLRVLRENRLLHWDRGG